MVILQHLLPKGMKFVLKSSREITFEFIKEGYSTIPKYSTASYNKEKGFYLPRFIVLMTWALNPI